MRQQLRRLPWSQTACRLGNSTPAVTYVLDVLSCNSQSPPSLPDLHRDRPGEPRDCSLPGKRRPPPPRLDRVALPLLGPVERDEGAATAWHINPESWPWPARGCFWRIRPTLARLTRALSTAAGEEPLSEALVRAIERQLAAIEARYADLSAVLLEEPSRVGHERLAAVNKELSGLEEAMAAARALRRQDADVASLAELEGDPAEEAGMRRLAAEERRAAAAQLEETRRGVLRLLLPRDEADARGCILEVRAGSGGDEASLFAMDIFKMYERFAARMRWKFEVLDVAESDLRGLKEASASISGVGAFGQLKFESGVHRVQRVPATEKSGRVHTSAASVAVLPQADEVDVQVRGEDLRIDTYRAGGAGGQSVNTTSSAVRVTHLPTGIAVAIQDERSQHMNKAKALKVLRAKLFDIERRRHAASRAELRQGQIGTGDRSERIRTYNFVQGRVTDHRVGLTLHALDHVLEGEGLEDFVSALAQQQEMAAVAALGE